MDVQPLTVGPILGATTGATTRIWGRGEYEQLQSGPRRCFGVARMRESGQRFHSPRFFKMNPNFDMTGVVVFDELKPETSYVYQAGWFYSDREPDELEDRLSLDWNGIPSQTFTTASEDDSAARSFVFGSCRYVLRLFGGSWFDDRGDKTFRSILRQINSGVKTDGLLMIGDQIYADDMSFLVPDRSLEQYNERYREVFSQRYIRELMSRVPSYMTLDDHEIEDGWPAHATMKDWMVKYPAAIHAYQTYQASHSPLFELAGSRIAGRPDRWWYSYQDGCCDFFVTDTRTERNISDDPDENKIISDTQMDALKAWLNDGSGRVKLVASAVPVFPEMMADNSDKWGGFPEQRSELLDFIRVNDIRRVVFLSGDVHSSLSAELISPEAQPGFKMISVISSAYFWPYPHTSKRSFRLSGTFKSTESGATYKVVDTGETVSTDNFTRVTADLEKVKIEVFSRKGKELSSRSLKF
ncbi:MAG: alkaline phosphatase family protein [Chloroflexota bacterium]|nr:MAG: alkaline phosphatase family protein [Chloroflexota bacterium]